MPKILVDADACPVKEIIIDIATQFNLKVIMFSNFSHEINITNPNVEVIRVDSGADVADFKIVNAISAGDIVVTQDYGLATMVLAKNSLAISPRGLVFDNNNIDILLLNRHINKVNRKHKKYSPIPKRTKEDDDQFRNNFVKLCTVATS